MPGRYKVADPIPDWMFQKPTTHMKLEWENAFARFVIQANMSAGAAKKVNIAPGQLLMFLRQEHKRWHEVEIGHMVTTNEVINSLNTYMKRFVTRDADLKRLIEENRERTDLLELPPTPKTHGQVEAKEISRTDTEKPDDPSETVIGQQ